MIALTASNSRTSKAWAVVFQGPPDQQKVRLVATAPALPVMDEHVALEVVVAGEDAGSVSSVQVTNGANDEVVTESRGNPLSIPLAEGRNELLVEGFDDGQRLAATTLMVSRAAKPPDPDATTGFSDGTFALCQSGVVTLRLPDTVSMTTVNGQESYWLRVRIIRGDYGTEAAYKLKKPLAPEEGFMLIPASFRPPLLSKIRIGYEQTLGGVPEVCLAYNNLEFENLTGASPFEPFRPAPEPGNWPVLYLGFTLPLDRAAFPNRTLSLFSRVADVKYGEKVIPISPHHSKGSGDPGSAVIHRLTITNAAPVPASLTLAVLGTIWPTDVVPQRMDLAAGESREAEVRVTIPSDAPVDSSDWGFVRLVATDAPTSEHSATFVTFAGTEPPSDRRLQLCWEYWNGTAWGRLTVRDDAESFTRPGLIQFLAPPDFASRSEFGLDRHWVRVRWESGEYAFEPRLHRMLLNTTMAAQTITIRNETLGSSDGSEHQTFRTTRAPVLAGQQVKVREPEMPSAEERATIEREEGKDAISPAGGPREHWVRWHQVPDFYDSGPRDRHYVLDHLTGQIRFGDGLNGLIPPVGAGNIRMARYKTGGGAAGNRPAGTIVQLKTTVPYVDKAINTEAAAGGDNAEALDLLLNRAPRTLRHRGRAVTLEDYQDLARQASPEVARAKCVPLSNLVDDPLAVEPSVPGAVSVIIVPRSAEAKPLPSLELVNRVQDYLEANGIPTADISVVGPLYVSVNVSAEIALASLEGASEVEHTVYQRLAGFLHPLTGGLDGTGWAFGREPHNSDFYALIEAVPGVDHVRTLQVDATEDQPGVRDTGRFLVYSGTHQIRLVFEGSVD